jgi:hypothetical protein
VWIRGKNGTPIGRLGYVPNPNKNIQNFSKNALNKKKKKKNASKNLFFKSVFK